MQPNVTERWIKAVKSPTTGRVRRYDGKQPGFGATVYPSGLRTFFVEWGPVGRRRRLTLGVYPSLHVDDARKLANAKLAELAKGGVDPAEEKRVRRAMPTVRGWVETYLAGVRLRKKRPRDDVRFLGWVTAKWGPRNLDALTAEEIEGELRELAKRGPIQANRWYASLRACLAAAVRAGIVKVNPATFVAKLPENPPRQRVLTDAERSRLLLAINALPTLMEERFQQRRKPKNEKAPAAGKQPLHLRKRPPQYEHERALFLLLLQTGCRKSEALTATWENVSLDGEPPLWTIPSPKAGTPQTVPLPRGVVAVLRRLPRDTSGYVFPGRRHGDHRREVRETWEALRAEAKLDGVTLHDLRRDYGLRAAKAFGILVASKLLRHGDTRITSRVYAPLAAADLAAVSETLAANAGKVLPMRSRGRK